MKKFKLVGIKHPGLVNLPKLGNVELANITDELARELYNKGLPYLRPVKKKVVKPTVPEDDSEKKITFFTGPENDTPPV